MIPHDSQFNRTRADTLFHRVCVQLIIIFVSFVLSFFFFAEWDAQYRIVERVAMGPAMLYKEKNAPQAAAYFKVNVRCCKRRDVKYFLFQWKRLVASLNCAFVKTTNSRICKTCSIFFYRLILLPHIFPDEKFNYALYYM